MGSVTINQNRKQKKRRSGLEGKYDFFFGHGNYEVGASRCFIQSTNMQTPTRYLVGIPRR